MTVHAIKLPWSGSMVLTTTLYTNSNLAAYSLFAFHPVVFDLIILAAFKVRSVIYRALALWMNEAATSLGKLQLKRGVG